MQGSIAVALLVLLAAPAGAAINTDRPAALAAVSADAGSAIKLAAGDSGKDQKGQGNVKQDNTALDKYCREMEQRSIYGGGTVPTTSKNR